jgi:hypothetical protein
MTGIPHAQRRFQRPHTHQIIGLGIVAIAKQRGLLEKRNRREVGQARLHFQQFTLLLIEHFDMARRVRPWANHAHLPKQNIAQLRQFIEFVTANTPAQRRHAAVTRTNNIALHAVSTLNHAADLIHSERASVQSDARRDIKGPLTVLRKHRQRHQQNQWQHKN